MSILIASTEHKAVIGLGQTGVSVGRYLRDRGQLFSAFDSRSELGNIEEIQQQWPEVQLHLGQIDEGSLLSFSEVILSPGVSRDIPAVKAAIAAGIPVIGDIELFAREASSPIIAITGTNGKTTVTSLVGEMAKACGINVGVGGNIGTPALDLLDKNYQLYILELSSFQLESTEKLAAEVACILNISPDHMDRYSSMQAYMVAKQRISFAVKNMVVNRDDPLTYPPLPDAAKVHRFGMAAPDLKDFGLLKQNDELYFAKGLKALMPITDLKIKGMHNVQNALAALAIGAAADFDLDAMLSTLKTFAGVDHRCQLIATQDNVAYFNDSKATNPGATKAAIEGLQQGKNIILLCGGDGKGLDFSVLQPVFNKYLKALICFGRDGQALAGQMDDKDAKHVASSLQDAVNLAKQLAQQGDIVLLSPACASFDMFKNYQDRGQQFVQAVLGADQ